MSQDTDGPAYAITWVSPEQDTVALERLYAAAIQRLATLSDTLDAVRSECDRLLDDNRQLKAGATK